MKILRKWLIRLSLAAVLLVGLSVCLLWLYLDRVAAKALTAGLQWAGNVSSTVGSVRLSPLRGRIRIDSLAVGNPPGYTSKGLLQIARARVVMDFRTIWNGPVNVALLELDGPVVRVEPGGGCKREGTSGPAAGGSSNVQVFLEAIQGKFAAPSSKPAAPPMRIRVGKVIIRKATVQICSTANGPPVDVPLESIEMHDLSGVNGQGVTSAELAGLIVFELVRKAAMTGNVNFAQLVPPDVNRAMEAMIFTSATMINPVGVQSLSRPWNAISELVGSRKTPAPGGK